MCLIGDKKKQVASCITEMSQLLSLLLCAIEKEKQDPNVLVLSQTSFNGLVGGALFHIVSYVWVPRSETVTSKHSILIETCNAS